MFSAETYRQYRAELNGKKVTDSARVGALVVIGLNTAFIALDWWAHREQFRELATVRIVWDVVMCLVYWALAVRSPLQVMLAGLYATGLGMLAVIGLAGGVTSDYWPGMMILFLGIPVVLPLSVFEVAGFVATISVGFVGLPIVTGEIWELHAFAAPFFFVCGAAIECVASTMALEGLRLRDFERRKDLEAARDHLCEMDRVKARFTANVHHELRTPLTLTLAPVEGLLAGEFGSLTNEQASYLRTVHSNALRLLKLINNLLDLAKIESKQLEIRRRPVDVPALASHLVQGAIPLAERAGINLSVEAQSGIQLIYADPDALEKILMNLLGNALKFTTRGDEVTVRIKAHAEGGIHCAVADTGEGLGQDQLERIFDRFAQVDASATRKHEGTGIGLSLTQELVALHGGRVWAESAGLGKGTTVQFWLPEGEADRYTDELALEEDNQPASQASSAGANIHQEAPVDRYIEIQETVRRTERRPVEKVHAESGRPRVLICEDNTDMRRLLADLVRKEFNVRLAENGRVGLAAVLEDPPDLVLTDVMMPEMSGIELCAALKSNPDTAPIPVVLVTSKAERDMKIAGLEEGADDYVTKPFHARELMARVRSLIKLRRVSAELAVKNDTLEQANRELARAMEELKEAEAQMVRAERLAAVGELAAGLAHEVNNPVNFAVSAAKTLASFVTDLRKGLEEAEGAPPTASGSGAVMEAAEGIEELSGIIAEGLNRTHRLVANLRDLGSPSDVDRKPIDLRQVVESALQLTRYFLQKRGVAAEVNVPAELPPVIGDSGALSQVVLNLLKNAAEALETSSEGKIAVEIHAENAGVLLTVSDNGPGVPESVAGRLYEPFVTTKSAGEGTGLGLSICKRIVEEHRGTIETMSAPSGGTQVSVWLPSEAVHES